MRASHNGVASLRYIYGGRMDNNETYLAQQQQIDTAGFVANAIGVVMLVVMVVWGFRQVRRTIKGEPVEEIPFEIPYGS